jgi:DNA polymerase-3 subunit epsilon
MNRFTVFDVETPNRENNRMSAIGITVIENGEIADEYYSLVDPETYFDYFNTRLTGIDEDLVSDAKNFEEVWREIKPLMSSGMIVAHNAVFDLGVLKKCLEAYGIEWRPYVRYMCTVQIGRRALPGIRHGLGDMCDYYGLSLNHHHAASDAHACAEILLRYISDGIDINKSIRTFKFR